MAEKEEEKKVEKETTKKAETKPVEKKETPKKEEVKKETTAPKKEEAKKEEPKKEDKKFEPVKTTETKKATTTKTKETAKPKEKKKNIAARILAVAVILLVVVGLIYIALPSPARALQQMLTNLKAGNIEKVEEYADYTELMNTSILSSENTDQTKLFLQNLEFAVKNVKQEGDTAKIELETTNKDFKVIVRNAATKLLQKYFSSEDAEVEEILLEELQKDDIPTATTTQEITVQKQDGKWKVVPDDNLRNAIFPGLMETLETLTSGEF